MSAVRTPGPWRTESGSFGYVLDSHGEILALCEAEDGTRSSGQVNAAFIVEACNNYDRVLAERDALALLLRRARSVIDALGTHKAFLAEISAALAKVQP